MIHPINHKAAKRLRFLSESKKECNIEINYLKKSIKNMNSEIGRIYISLSGQIDMFDD